MLDEPDAGLDSQGLQVLENALKHRSHTGKSILVSLHNPHLINQFEQLDLNLSFV
jgi:ABC-type protease/lipase transport system fused ATPase/permease subunit